MKLFRLFLELFVLLILWFLGIVVVNGIPMAIITATTSLPVTIGMDMVNYPWFVLIGHILQSIGTILSVYLFFVIFGGKLKDLGFSPKGKLRDIGWGLLYGAGTILCGFLILLALGFITIAQGSVNLLSMFACLLTFFFVALSEEVLCRGAMISISLKYSNKVVALIVPSLIFGVMHIFNNDFDWLSFGNIFLAGIFMGIYYLYYRNLWFPIAIHLAWNYVQGPILGFAVSGAITPQLITQTQHGPPLWTGGAFGFEGSILGLILLGVASAAVYVHFRKVPELVSSPLSVPSEFVPSPQFPKT